MKMPLSGALLALISGAAAVAQTASTDTPSKPKTSHTRRSFFTSNQARADVPAHVERLFKQLDLNQDGFVTRDEIAAAQAKFDERTAKSAPERIAKAFDRLDTNHDGKITRDELEAARAARLAARGKTAKPGRRSGIPSWFVHADANKDGVVTRAEYEAAAASGKLKLRHAAMRGSMIVRLFDEADANKDGKVSLEEAKAAALRQFDAADVNHDGVLTPEERRQASKAKRAKRSAK